MSSDFISLRKDQLRFQISEALEVGDQDQLIWLRSQWVHRHGIDTLQEAEKYKKEIEIVQDLSEVKTSCKTNFEEIETGLIAAETPENIKENKFFASGDFLSIDDSQSKNFADQQKNKISDTETQELATQKNSIAFQSPPKPSINHLRRWLTSLDRKLPKAS